MSFAVDLEPCVLRLTLLLGLLRLLSLKSVPHLLSLLQDLDRGGQTGLTLTSSTA